MLKSLESALMAALECEFNFGIAPARRYDELLPILSRQNTPFVRKDYEERINPFLILPSAKSIIAVVISSSSIPKGQKYREFLRDKLKEAIEKIKNSPPSFTPLNSPLERGGAGGDGVWQEECPKWAGWLEYKIRVDRGELVERHIAYLAGLGWFGRNHMLFNPKFGNDCYIGLIITNLDLPISAPIPNSCTKCGECIAACPAGAFNEDSFTPEKCLNFKGVVCKGCFCHALRELKF